MSLFSTAPEPEDAAVPGRSVHEVVTGRLEIGSTAPLAAVVEVVAGVLRVG